MGLMEGLSHWLRQIVAVILLAALIDLLLPNRTMQRYVRLVAGLFILMTLATPLMNWMRGDFTNQLASGLQSVEKSPQDADSQLAMIEKAGSELRDKHQIQAAKLVSSRLEASIRNEVEQTERREVRKVDVELGQDGAGQLTVANVTVTLEPEPAAANEHSGPAPVQPMEPVQAVDVQIDDITVGATDSHDAPTATGEHDQAVIAEAEQQNHNSAEDQLDRDTRLRISAMIASRFGLSVNIVEVKLPAAAEAYRN